MSTPYWPDKPRVLMSYAYRGSTTVNDSLAYAARCDLLIDSGAFTALSLGIKIDRSEYVDFLLKERAYITHAASLDVIGDWKASARNFEWMRGKLADQVSLIPAWHLGSPLKELDRLCKTEPYVAIGGCVPYSKRPKLLMKHLIQAHQVARKHGTELHGLGVTGKETMTRLPWASVDSSSWTAGHRFGGAHLTDERGKMHTVPFGRKLTPEQRKLVRAYEGDPRRVQHPDFNLVGRAGEQGRQDRYWSNVAAARAFYNIEGKLRARNKTAFRLYLVTSSPVYTEEAMDAHALGSPFATREEKQARQADEHVNAAATMITPG